VSGASLRLEQFLADHKGCAGEAWCRVVAGDLVQGWCSGCHAVEPILTEHLVGDGRDEHEKLGSWAISEYRGLAELATRLRAHVVYTLMAIRPHLTDAARGRLQREIETVGMPPWARELLDGFDRRSDDSSSERRA
jgi:hypothetical protein